MNLRIFKDVKEWLNLVKLQKFLLIFKNWQEFLKCKRMDKFNKIIGILKKLYEFEYF